jgi:hypothetical protein
MSKTHPCRPACRWESGEEEEKGIKLYEENLEKTSKGKQTANVN